MKKKMVTPEALGQELSRNVEDFDAQILDFIAINRALGQEIEKGDETKISKVSNIPGGTLTGMFNILSILLFCVRLSKAHGPGTGDVGFSALLYMHSIAMQILGDEFESCRVNSLPDMLSYLESGGNGSMSRIITDATQ